MEYNVPTYNKIIFLKYFYKNVSLQVMFDGPYIYFV